MTIVYDILSHGIGTYVIEQVNLMQYLLDKINVTK